ncbi:MAG: preprotein translocase subunit SecE [Eggerthellaceae bacterium]|nr:preprotein translocase subunit SecE [Eggerthellaceae bacterium]
MAQKSKTQRAKASAARAARKEQAAAAAAALEAEATEKGMTVDELVAANEAAAAEEAKKAQKKSLFKKKDDSADADKAKDADKAPKKERFKFFKDVRAELKRVTWPTKQEVIRWSVVVVVALLFFGLYVALLDNAIVTPLLVLISGLGA